MKIKIAFSALLLVLVFAAPAVAAPTSPVTPHGNYINDTSQCARCHSTHTALSARLLNETSEKLSCYVCHDGTQSNYNVKSGTYWNGETDLPSAAGGFNTEAPDSYTSIHAIETSVAAPGGLSSAMYLACSSCHNPHGYPSTNNFRMLQKKPGGVLTPVTVTASVTQVYNSYAWPDSLSAPLDPNFITPRPAVPSKKEIVSYISGVDAFCVACHSDYIAYGSNNAASNPFSGSVAGQWNYRHRVGVTMNGGAATGAKPGDGYWRSMTYPEPGLYSTLPTLGAATGAYVYSLNVNSGSGTLPANNYYYVVTTLNYGGAGGAVQESRPANARATGAGASGSITVTWTALSGAAGYNIYRAVYGASPPLTTDYRLLNPAPLWDNNSYTFTDNGSLTPGGSSPPTDYSAKIMCLTCHYAHGTKATVGPLLSSQGPRLLRLNNRGVCENCHKKGAWN